jgi:hypothetical protein
MFRKRRAGFGASHAREQAALDIHDNIVQGLAEAQLALDLGRTDQAREVLDRTLAQARRIVTDLMGDAAPGDLRRGTAAGDDLASP